MLEVSDKFKQAIRQPSRLLKSLVVVGEKIYTDTEIMSIKYEDNLFFEEDFTLGTAIMTSISLEFKISQDIIDTFKEGVEFETKIGIEVENSKFEYISLGLFTIEDIDKTAFKFKIGASDRMIKFEKEYSTDLIFPASLASIAEDIASKAGVELKTKSFINSGYIVNIKPDLKGISLRKALMAISELAGGYARINRSGELEIFNISMEAYNSTNYASVDTYTNNLIDDELVSHDLNTVTGDNFINFNNKAFTISSIDKLIIEIPGIKAEAGDGENIYYIVDNLFCQNPSAVIKNIYDAISKISYIPYDIKLQGNPALQSGDPITIKHNGAVINTLITSRTLNYIGGLTEQYKAVGKSNTEKQSTGKGNVALELGKLKTEIKVIEGEISEKVSNDEFESYKKQTAEEISSKVSNSKFESYVKQTAEEIATKVTGEDVETLVKQDAESWGISINGKLSGKTYRFDGENFSIGSDENGDKAQHTNTHSKWVHSDGSYTKIGPDGLERYDGPNKKLYMYSNELVFVRIGAGQTVRVNHSDDFKSKRWVASYSVRGVRPGSAEEHHVLSRMLLSHSNSSGTGFDLKCELYWATSFGQIVTIESGGYIDVSVQFIG